MVEVIEEDPIMAADTALVRELMEVADDDELSARLRALPVDQSTRLIERLQRVSDAVMVHNGREALRSIMQIVTNGQPLAPAYALAKTPNHAKLDRVLGLLKFVRKEQPAEPVASETTAESANGQ